jgi:hypothetical protein
MSKNNTNKYTNSVYKNTLIRSLKKWNEEEILQYFHEPDSFCLNYYWLDLRQGLIFILPSRVDAGPIIMELLDFQRRTIILNTGEELHLGDIIWKESSRNLDKMYPSANIIDPTAACGEFNCLLHRAIYGTLYRNDLEGAVNHRNGNKNDARWINLEFTSVSNNNKNTHKTGYEQSVPTIEYPTWMLPFINKVNNYKKYWYTLPSTVRRKCSKEVINEIIKNVVAEYNETSK